jgi:hypothetical protein
MALYGEKEWYFFTPRDRKYPNGSRPNRAAGSGYWKATGADKPVGTPKPLAIKKALVFYAGKAPKGEKTNWIMHEYRLADVDRSARKKNSLRVTPRFPSSRSSSENRVTYESKSKKNGGRRRWYVMCCCRNEGSAWPTVFWAAEKLSAWAHHMPPGPARGRAALAQ